MNELQSKIFTLALESVNFKIASFFLRSQITQRCEKVEARICCTINKNKEFRLLISFNLAY